jgi:hypothetical protein
MDKLSDVISSSSPREDMIEYVGKCVQTSYEGLMEHIVIGVTETQLRNLNIGHETLTEYFLREYDIQLQKLDYPCFIGENGTIVPPELACRAPNEREFRRWVSRYFYRE